MAQNKGRFLEITIRNILMRMRTVEEKAPPRDRNDVWLFSLLKQLQIIKIFIRNSRKRINLAESRRLRFIRPLKLPRYGLEEMVLEEMNRREICVCATFEQWLVMRSIDFFVFAMKNASSALRILIIVRPIIVCRTRLYERLECFWDGRTTQKFIDSASG